MFQLPAKNARFIIWIRDNLGVNCLINPSFGCAIFLAFLTTLRLSCKVRLPLVIRYAKIKNVERDIPDWLCCDKIRDDTGV